MGLPTTWFLLNLVHLFWIDYAVKGAPNKVDQMYLRKSVAICGDDLVAFWPNNVVERYHAIAKACKAEFSSKKHFKSRRGRGVFTESVFQLLKGEESVHLPRRLAMAVPVEQAKRPTRLSA
jgi:hypothetical protein